MGSTKYIVLRFAFDIKTGVWVVAWQRVGLH